MRGLGLRGWTRARRSPATVLALGALLWLGTAAPAGAAQSTALWAQVASPARAVFGSDGHEHIDYDLVIGNAFTVPVTLESVRVFGRGRLLLSLTGSALAEHALAGTSRTATIPVSSYVKTLVDVVLPRSFGRRAPKRLTEKIRYAVPPDAPARAIIGSTTVPGPRVPVISERPIRIASPLYGAGWANANGCCGDPTSEHRTLLLPADGSFRTPEMFAIDWIRERGGSIYTGDGSKNSDWAGFGARVHAVADGVVVSTVDNRAEVAPFVGLDENPTVRGPQDFSGNNVVERIAPGQYAVYVHLQTGSVRVKVGQRLRTGQVVGLLGNTGNTNGAHLHFGIQDSPNILGSNSLPFEIRRFTVDGSVGAGTKPGSYVITGSRHRARLAEPLIGSVFSF